MCIYWEKKRERDKIIQWYHRAHWQRLKLRRSNTQILDSGGNIRFMTYGPIFQGTIRKLLLQWIQGGDFPWWTSLLSCGHCFKYRQLLWGVISWTTKLLLLTKKKLKNKVQLNFKKKWQLIKWLEILTYISVYWLHWRMKRILRIIWQFLRHKQMVHVENKSK
jgi:hypothetical protein